MRNNGPEPARVIVNDKAFFRTQSDGKKVEGVFYISNCCKVPGTIKFNIFWLIVCISTYIMEGYMSGDFFRNACFLTNVSLLLTSFYLMVSLLYMCSGAKTQSTLYKWVRVTHLISISAESTVLAFYWGVIAKDTIPDYPIVCKSPLWCYIYTSIAHGFVIIPPWTILLCGWVEIKAKDIIYPFVVAVVYIVFILFPYTTLVSPLYDVITFKDTMSFVFSAAAVLLMVVCFFVVYLVSLCRGCKFESLYGKRLGGKIEKI